MNELLKRLPHKAPALLLGEVLSIDEASARCQLLQTRESCYSGGDYLPAALGLEAMAQAAAVWVSWRYDGQSGRGMLVQCRHLVMKQHQLRLGPSIEVEARPVSVGSATGLYSFSGEIRDADAAVLVSAEFLILVERVKA